MLHSFDTGPFSSALLDPKAAKPSGIVGPKNKAADKRFNVYRNNVAYSLVEALGKNFPAVLAQCGRARFNDAARLYLNEHPPRSKIMFELGFGFPEWLDEFAPAKQQMPWLTDLARLERAWLQSYHAEDAAPLSAAEFSTIAPDAMGGLQFIKHPAANLICSQYSIFSLLEKGRNGEVLPNPVAPQDVLLTRPQLEVEVRLLPDGSAAFLANIFAKANLKDVAEAGLKSSSTFDLSGNLSGLLLSGATTAIF